MPRPHRRRKVQQERARETQLAQKAAEVKKLTYRQYVLRRAMGWSLVGLAVAVGASHWLAHLGLLYEDRAVWDLTIGYPTAALLGIAGAVVLSR
jgi:hypothetical protein